MADAASIPGDHAAAVDLDSATVTPKSPRPSRVVAARDDGDMLVDRYRLTASTLRLEAERTVLRNGQARPLRSPTARSVAIGGFGGCHGAHGGNLAAEVADCMAFLCSPASSSMTGACLDVNGGVILR